MFDRRGDELVVFGVDVAEADEVVQQFITENRYTFPVLMDRDRAVMQAYGVRGIPTYVVIDREGTVKAVWVGFPGVESLHAVFDEAGLH